MRGVQLMAVLSAALVAGTTKPCLGQTPGAVLSTLPTYGAPRIRLKGKAHVDASVSKSAEVRIVSGTVTDDALRPAAATVTLSILRQPETIDSADVAQPLPPALPLVATQPQPCGTDEPPVLETSTRLVLATDTSGRFCVRLHLSPDRYVARIAVRATTLLDVGVRELAFDSSLDDVTLRFPAEPLTVPLESGESTVEVDAFADLERRPIPAPGLVLDLVDESGSRLGEATTDAFGQAQFHVPSARLGPPGMGTFRVTFAGNRTYGPSARDAPVERTLGVRLVLPNAPLDGTLPPGRPEEGVALRVRAEPAGVRHLDALPTGIVEARVGDTVVGAGTLTHGQTRFVATFGTRGPGPVPMTLRYVPDAPWFQPRADLHVLQPVKGPSLWRRLAMVLTGALALAWFVGLRLPLRWRLVAFARPPNGDGAQGGVRIVTAGMDGGWQGRVTDAHDGGPVVGASVRIERPTFRGSSAVIHAVCDADGQFVLPPADVLPGDRLIAEAHLHAPLRQVVPPPGEIAIALVLRRRAVLDRLISFARRHRGPFDGRPEPTPSEIRHAAPGDSSLARWALEVERAAFGAAPVDARRQGEVDRHAPGGDDREGDAIRRGPAPARGSDAPPQGGDPPAQDSVPPAPGGDPPERGH